MPKREQPVQEDTLQRRNVAPSAENQDAWDEIMDMKSTSLRALVEDENGFTKMNTSFYLMDGEACKIQLLSDVPILFSGHLLKLRSKKNKDYYLTEACQKSMQNHCVLCDSKLSNVGEAGKKIAFPILDYRGTFRKKDDKGTQDGFDNIPVPKIFLMPLGLAKGIKKLRDEAGGTLVDKVLDLSKEQKNYFTKVSMEAKGGGNFAYRKAATYTGKIPNINVLYGPQKDEALDAIINYTTKKEGDTSSSDEGGIFDSKK